MATIAFHCGTTVSQRHNRRDEKLCSKEKHIDLERVHENWIDEPVREAYERIFGEATRGYNAKQKRADRKIDSYYTKIKEDKQKNILYEAVVGVYDKNLPEEVCKEILQEVVENWKERNPNLELIGAYYHFDEQGKNPHVHLDYIPVIKNQNRGLSVQNALSKALVEQEKEQCVSKWGSTPQIRWEARERAFLEELCKAKGIHVKHPQQGMQIEHLEKELYVAQQKVMELNREVKELKRERTIEQKKVIEIVQERNSLEREVSYWQGQAEREREVFRDFQIEAEKEIRQVTFEMAEEIIEKSYDVSEEQVEKIREIETEKSIEKVRDWGSRWTREREIDREVEIGRW